LLPGMQGTLVPERGILMVRYAWWRHTGLGAMVAAAGMMAVFVAVAGPSVPAAITWQRG